MAAPALVMLGKYLVANGLPLLANAALAKGKEYVEEKIGVKLPDPAAPVSPAELLELKRAEFAHQEFLIQASIEKRKLDLEDFRAEVADKESARTRDVELARVGQVNWRGHVMVAVAYALVFYLAYEVLTSANLNEFAKGVITLLLGRSLGWLDNIYNFEFGTTRGSRQKDETISRLAGEK